MGLAPPFMNRWITRFAFAGLRSWPAAVPKSWASASAPKPEAEQPRKSRRFMASIQEHELVAVQEKAGRVGEAVPGGVGADGRRFGPRGLPLEEQAVEGVDLAGPRDPGREMLALADHEAVVQDRHGLQGRDADVARPGQD